MDTQVAMVLLTEAVHKAEQSGLLEYTADCVAYVALVGDLVRTPVIDRACFAGVWSSNWQRSRSHRNPAPRRQLVLTTCLPWRRSCTSLLRQSRGYVMRQPEGVTCLPPQICRMTLPQ